MALKVQYRIHTSVSVDHDILRKINKSSCFFFVTFILILSSSRHVCLERCLLQNLGPKIF